jgi:hypothetical protein
VSEKVGPIVHLKGKAGEQLSLALLDSYLLVAAERWAIDRAAGFFTEELRAEQRKSEGVFAEASRAALFGPLSKIVKSMWQAQRRELDVSLNATRAAQGRPPDFAEPSAAMAAIESGLDAVLAVLQTSDKLTLAAVPGHSGLEVSAWLEPTIKGNAEELLQGMQLGDAKPLLALPRAVGVALLSRSSAKTRLESSVELAAQLKALLDARISPSDEAQLSQLLLDLAKGRGDVLTVAVAREPTPSVFFGTSVADAEHLSRFTDNFWKVFDSPAFAKPLEQLFGSPLKRRLSKESIFGSSLNLATLSPVRGAQAQVLGVAWTEPTKTFSASLSSKDTLKSFRTFLDPAAPSLASDTLVSAALGSVRASAWVLLLQPAALGLLPASPPGASQGPPFGLLSVGRDGRRGTLSLSVSPFTEYSPH